MKLSISLSILILALAAVIDWRDDLLLASARERNSSIVRKAAKLGISLNPTQSNGDPVLIRKRERIDPKADAKRAVDQFIAMVREADAIEEGGGTVEHTMATRIMERLSSLDADEAEILITGMLDGTELKGEYREGFISIAIMKLANDGPRAALMLLPRLTGVFHDPEDEQKCREAVVNSSLTAWSREDPAAAAAWVRENGVRFSECITESTKCGILSGSVAVDPALAFKLIDELEIKDSSQAVTSIARAATTTPERIATLAALRGYLTTIADVTTRKDTATTAIQQLAFGSHKQGFDATAAWLAEAKLSPAESDAFITTVAYANLKSDTVKWIGWLEKNLPAERANERIYLLVYEWTEADYQAVGKWLVASPDGSIKNTAVQIYAAAVSKYEPEAATRWAMTLPAGKDRDLTLGEIYRNLPEGNPAAKAAFAREHGIQEKSE